MLVPNPLSKDSQVDSVIQNAGTNRELVEKEDGH